MSDFYASYLKDREFLELLKKEHSAKSISKKRKIPIATVYRMLQSLEKHNVITIRETKTKDNKTLRLYNLKTITRTRK